MSISYYECVYVALVIQHAKRVCYIAVCGLSGPTIFFSHCLINGKIFGNKILNVEMYFDFLCNSCLKIFSC